MAVAVAAVYTGGGGSATSVATNAVSPAGSAPTAGNLLVAFVGYRTVTGVTVTATGWTGQTAVNDGTVGGHRVLTKVSDGTETATMTFQLAASVKAAVVVIEFSGSSATLKSITAGGAVASAAAHTGSAVTPATGDYVLLLDQDTVSDAATVSSNGSATPTTGWTNTATGASTGGNATTRNKVVASYITSRSVSTTPSITWSAAVTGTLQQALIQPPLAPNAPASSAASGITAGGFTANWSASTVDSSHDAATSYQLDVSTNSGFSSMVSGYNGLDVGNVTSYPVTGLTGSTPYWYRIRAANVTGTSGNSTAQNPTTSAPSLSGSRTAATATGSGAGLVFTPLPVIRITSLTAKTLSQVSGHTQSVLTFRTDQAATAWQVRLDSTSTADGTLVQSGGSLAANTDQNVTIDAAVGALNLAEGGHSIQVYCQVAGTYRANRPGYRYGFYRAEELTSGEINTAISNNQGWIVVQAFWERLQTTNGGALDTTELSTLRTQINNVADNGGKVILSLSTQYPHAWVATGAVKFKNQFATEYTGTGGGNVVYDYVWSATMRGYLDDFITKFFTTLDAGTPYINVAKISAVHIGGLLFNELEYPPHNYDGSTLASITYWGYSSPAQGGGGLATGQVACPLASTYVPFGTGSNDTDDATWINWYLDSLVRYMSWWITRVRQYCTTQDLYVLHPDWGVRTDRSLPTNKLDVSYRQQLAVGTDWARQIAAYRWTDRVYPWSTWLNDSRGTPWNTDSDKPPWESLYLMAQSVGKHHYIMGEAAGGSVDTDMDRIFTDTQQGALQRGYLGIVWVDFTGLKAGSAGTLANFTTRTTQTLPP